MYIIRRYMYYEYISFSAKVKHLSSLTSQSQPFASLSAKLPTQVTKTPTQVENPNYVSPANTGSKSGKHRRKPANQRCLCLEQSCNVATTLCSSGCL